MSEVRLLTPAEARKRIPELAEVLVDCVTGGASVNFMEGYSMAEAVGFFADVADAVAAGDKAIFGGFVDGRLLGTVQLVTRMPPNQPHRADVSKMLVHRDARRSGLATALMRALEAEAARRGKSLLCLDTGIEGEAVGLYDKLGYQRVGVIPGFALWPDGRPCDTLFYYKAI